MNILQFAASVPMCSRCGKRRLPFRNGDGLGLFRCPDHELEDILAYLRGDYGPESSRQFAIHEGFAEFEVFTCPRCRGHETVSLYLSGICWGERICRVCNVVFEQTDTEFLRSAGIAVYDPEAERDRAFLRSLGIKSEPP